MTEPKLLSVDELAKYKEAMRPSTAWARWANRAHGGLFEHIAAQSAEIAKLREALRIKAITACNTRAPSGFNAGIEAAADICMHKRKYSVAAFNEFAVHTETDMLAAKYQGRMEACEECETAIRALATLNDDGTTGPDHEKPADWYKAARNPAGDR